ncbi:MAG TPA: fatty acid desaturase [Pirellulales bacterium]|jgi:fatty acid desaturase|nr:fatty acid desaturase [Pirellulales bacterium]
MMVRTSPKAALHRPSTTDDDARSATLAINEARALVDDLFAARPIIYWTDLLLTLAVAYPVGAIYLSAPPFSLLQGISFLITGFALFRAGSFIHEIAHMRGGQMLSFRIIWNLLCGIPFIMPSHFYENHVDHHNSHHYGTLRDGEYLPLGAGPVRDIFWFFLQAPFFPLYIALRLLLSPITFVHPRLRTWVLEHMSSYVIHFRHRLTIPKSAPRRAWAALEIACSIRLAIMLGVVVIGIYPWGRLVQIYCLAVFTLLLNHIRNLVAHRYRNTGEPMSHADQLADSVTITGRRFSTELFFPLGLRYHALHHLFPAIPFHNLGRAHRRLMDQLPADSPYRQTVVPGYWAAVRDLWLSARASSRVKRPLAA